MAQALEVGKKALPHCRPNPPVGCIVVKDEYIAEGFTQPPGKCHAEPAALQQLSVPKGAIVVVTLEPCSFHGRTPSCAKLLIELGVTEVHVGILDPDPRNNGRGVMMLREAGIRVRLGVLAQRATMELGPYLNQASNFSPIDHFVCPPHIAHRHPRS